MPRRLTKTARSSPVRQLASALALAVGLLAVYSCSLIVSTNDTQCQSDADCTTFQKGATCDSVMHICVQPGATSTGSGSASSGGSCVGDAGCYACTPTDNTTLLNACTTGCIDFDNTRVKGLLPDGGVPLLPVPGPDGGM
jgi:hypothetical protein